MSQADCETIAAVAIRHDLLVLSDEVYWAIQYGQEHRSVLEVEGMAERTVLLDGWSKTFAMTGWRLGFGVFPPALVEPISRLVINSVSCTSAFSQRAAIAALAGPWQPVEQMVAEFARRRDVIVAGLNAIDGVTCVQPGGAFYAFPSVKSFGAPSKAIQEHLLFLRSGTRDQPSAAELAPGQLIVAWKNALLRRIGPSHVQNCSAIANTPT